MIYNGGLVCFWFVFDGNKRKYIRKNQKRSGFTLIETLISIALISIIVIGIMLGLATASKSLLASDNLQTARNLAESQMEYVRQLPYASSYEPASIPVDGDYIGFSVAIGTLDISDRDTNIQNITIVVSRYGNEITRLSSFKVR
jgi:prepilin-type N-terminal cleavage/methylation domain-containing protein